MSIQSSHQAEILTQVIQLYEFSLAIGNSTDLEHNCRSFFDRVLAKRNLSYAALWLKDLNKDSEGRLSLAYSDPANEYLGPMSLEHTSPLFQEIKQRQAFSLPREQLERSNWCPAVYLPKGESFTFAFLEHSGFIVFAGYGERGLWQPWQLNQMLPIFRSFDASIKSAQIFERLQFEIAERKRAEQAAQRASQVKTDFVANMSHELRTPLNAVLGMSQLLKETTLDREQQELVETISHSGESLLELINSILDFTKLESHMVKLESIPFELRRIATVIENIFDKDCKRKGLSFELAIDEKIPNHLLGDPLRIKQILMNLVSNAIKFTDDGGIRVAFDVVALEQASTRVMISVRDTGIGIAPEHIDLLFASFHQADSSISRKFGGTGLGLAICKQLCELMGGQIRADSQPGVGSVFFVEIPFTISVQEQHSSEVTAELSALTPRNTRARILVVEDNRVNQLVARKMLHALHCDNDVASSGIEALQLLSRNDYDLVLMDMQMPEMDGVETTRHIRSGESGVKNPEIHIIAMTANVSDNDKKQCMQAGMDDFVGKPVRKSLLAKKLRAALDL